MTPIPLDLQYIPHLDLGHYLIPNFEFDRMTVTFFGGPRDGCVVESSLLGERLDISLDPDLFGPDAVGFIRARDRVWGFVIDVYRLHGERACFDRTEVRP